jgi:hypothetical protein
LKLQIQQPLVVKDIKNCAHWRIVENPAVRHERIGTLQELNKTAIAG